MNRSERAKEVWSRPGYREHMSKVHIGNPGYWTGKKRSEETKQKISIKKLGIPNPITWGDKISKAMKGRKMSPSHYKNFLKSRPNHKKEHHPRWKGGEYPDYRGYILVYCINHPHPKFSNYVYKHRLVMEQHLNRYLLPTEVVHHINGNISDNRIENLMLFSSNSEHIKFHAKNKYKKYANPTPCQIHHCH